MAIYHFSAKMISRTNGSSAVASSAYRSGEKMNDERTGLNHDYTKKRGIEYTEILLPSEAPEWVSNREKLWNEVEIKERRKDSQLAREVNIALPIELNREQQIELTKKFVQDNFVSKGMIADIAIHDIGSGNPHAHVMLTTREITLDGFGKKNRAWNNKELLEQWREQWASYTNKALEKANIKERIDHRTLKEQGIDRLPEIHVGVHASAMEKKGIKTERGTLNREIKEFNRTKIVELQKYKKAKYKLELHDLAAEKEKVQNNIKSCMRKEKELRNEIGIEDKIKHLESNLLMLDKNIFGMYKDKYRATLLKDELKRQKKILKNLEYQNPEEIKERIKKAEDYRAAAESSIKVIDNKIEFINKELELMEKANRKAPRVSNKAKQIASVINDEDYKEDNTLDDTIKAVGMLKNKIKRSVPKVEVRHESIEIEREQQLVSDNEEVLKYEIENNNVGNISYKELKNSDDEITFRVIYDNLLEDLKRSSLNYAAFKKDDRRYNIVFKEKDAKLYENIKEMQKNDIKLKNAIDRVNRADRELKAQRALNKKHKRKINNRER